MKKHLISTFFQLLLASLFVAAISSCNLVNGKQIDIPDNVPLNEFIIGKWTSEQIDNSEGKESTYKYEIEFVDEDSVKFVVLSLEGEFLDGATSKYNFVDSDTIFVDNKRIQGGEQWLLERDGQRLIVHRTIDSETDRIVFARISNR
jgi:hypothetical protein